MSTAVDIQPIGHQRITSASLVCNLSQGPLTNNGLKGIPRSHSAVLFSQRADRISPTPTQLEPYSAFAQNLYQRVDSKPKYRVVNTDPFEYNEDINKDDDASKGDLDNNIIELPSRNSRRMHPRGSVSDAQKRMARVFNEDCAGVIDIQNEAPATLHDNAQLDLKLTGCATSALAGLYDAQTNEAREAVIINTWNTSDMDKAELYLQTHFDHRLRANPLEKNRRIRHLLGVICSLKGRWEQALVHFVFVLSTPLVHAAHLNSGDCAAAYWMGDIYTLLNRRVEALIAYSIAEQGLLNLKETSTPLRNQLLERVQVEQKICRGGNDKKYFEVHLDKAMQFGLLSEDSVLNPRVITRDTAQIFLELVQFSPDTGPAERNQSRAMALCKHDTKSVTWQELHKLRIDASAFAPSKPWPMLFDPLFAAENVGCGMPLSFEGDLLQLKEIPRTSGALTRSRMNCFTCQNLHWLITTLRKCMERLELKYTEVAKTTGTWLIPHYSSMEGTIASKHFISISIFRLTFRSGYGVEICPGGIFSSRIMETEEKGDDKGGHSHELKRIKELIRSYLDAALKRQEALEEIHTVIPVMSINGVTSIHRPISRGKRPESESSSSPATSSRSGSLFN